MSASLCDHPANVLLVDDLPANLLSLEAVLEDLGQKLVRARSGEEALRRLETDDFAVVLLDVHMHGLDGFETAKRIRGQENSRSTPIIFITAFESPQFPVQAAYDLGAVDYLIKPLLPTILRAKVMGFVDLYQKTEQVRRQAEQLRELERRAFERQLAEEKQRWELQRVQEFLALLAHELRNPLAPIVTGLHLARRQDADPSVREQALDMAERQVRHMTRLVDDLLDVSRITTGKLQLRPQPLDVAQLVRNVAEDRRSAIEQAGLKLVVTIPDTGLWVMGDSTRLSQVLSNLLDNARKFTDRGGEIAVRLNADRREAIVTVRDTGVGIEPAVLPRLFDVFVQDDRSLDRSRGGLGLGLSVVKALIELHGGQVLANSDGLGRGAEFTVRLPLTAEPVAAPGTATEPDARVPRRRVLLIEDNRDAAEGLRMLLELQRHEVRVAHSGPEGLAALAGWCPEVVLCDVGLPGGMSGYDVARRVRNLPGMGQAFLVALTGYGQDGDRQRGREAGFDHHVTKPADPVVLLKLVADRQRQAD